MSDWSRLEPGTQFRIALEVARKRGIALSGRYANVISVGAGFRSRREHDRPVAEVCLRFLVSRKWKRNRAGRNPIPPHIRARLRIRGKVRSVLIPTDVSEFHGAPQKSLDLTGGITSRLRAAKLDHGTACCLVRNAQSPGERYVLTCYHVLSPSMSESPGETDCISSADGGIIGPMLEIADPDGPSIALDAALVLVEDQTVDQTRIWSRMPMSRATDFDISALGTQSILYVHARRSTPGQPGGTRTSPLAAYFQSVFPTFPFDYRSTAGRYFSFPYTLQYVSNTRPGDSGAAVMDARNKLYGMHFYGEGNVGFALSAPQLFKFGVFPFDIELA